MDEPGASVVTKKAELDRLRSKRPGALANLEHAHDLELTYTPNAIEGNTLSAAETALEYLAAAREAFAARPPQ